MSAVIDGVRVESDALLVENAKLKADLIGAQRKLVDQNFYFTALQRQYHAVKAELARRDGHTNGSKGRANDEDDDDDIESGPDDNDGDQDRESRDPSHSSDGWLEIDAIVDGSASESAASQPDPDNSDTLYDTIHVNSPASRQDNSTTVYDSIHVARPLAPTAGVEMVRPDEASDTLAKKFRCATLEASARPVRKARQVGERRRFRQQRETEQFRFKLVTGYPSNNIIRAWDSEKCADLFPRLWKKIMNLTDGWEENGFGQLWFLDRTITEARKRVCIQSKILRETTHWRHEDDGRWACEKCVAAKLPCFTYDPQAAQFRLLPLHRADRNEMVRGDADVQQWLNL